MKRFMLRTSFATAALFAGAVFANAQSIQPPSPPPEAAPVPGDPGYEIPATPAPPVVPVPEDDSEDD